MASQPTWARPRATVDTVDNFAATVDRASTAETIDMSSLRANCRHCRHVLKIKKTEKCLHVYSFAKTPLEQGIEPVDKVSTVVYGFEASHRK